jgi:hypothetical protein
VLKDGDMNLYLQIPKTMEPMEKKELTTKMTALDDIKHLLLDHLPADYFPGHAQVHVIEYIEDLARSNWVRIMSALRDGSLVL